MRPEASFFGVAGEKSFAAHVYRLQPTVLRAQIRFVPAGARVTDTLPLPGMRRSERHIVEGTNLEEILAKSRSLIEQHAGNIRELVTEPPRMA